MPAVQFLQEGVVGAFGEAAFLVDKSQHAQFLKRKARQEGAEGERVKTELVTMQATVFFYWHECVRAASRVKTFPFLFIY